MKAVGDRPDGLPVQPFVESDPQDERPCPIKSQLRSSCGNSSEERADALQGVPYPAGLRMGRRQVHEPLAPARDNPSDDAKEHGP